MPRLMSVSHTTEQVRARTKTVTRRKGWWCDKNGRRLLLPGDRLTLCEKVMGRNGAPLVRICDVEVVDVSRQQLDTRYDANEAAREGFPFWFWSEFVEFFCQTFGGAPEQIVTRIEWRYLKGDA